MARNEWSAEVLLGSVNCAGWTSKLCSASVSAFDWQRRKNWKGK
jgi:hypothetical protein